VLQVMPQIPPLQIAVPLAGVGQTFPQLPQLLGLVCSSTQVPEQFIWPEGQQMPLEQLPLAHSALLVQGSLLGSPVQTPLTHCSVERQT
jgi:hypothetical protein